MPIDLWPRNPSLSRRDFLAGAAALSLARPAFGADEPPWYAWVSDTHVAADPKTRHLNQCMADNLRAVTADILAQESKPRGVFIDGDLALTDGKPGDYTTLLTLLEPLRAAGLPLHLALGNHDDRTHFRDALKAKPPTDADVIDKHISAIDGPGVRFVVLDSLDRVNVTPGLLGVRQLRWLGRTLDADAKTPTVVFVHHNLSNREGALIDTDALLGVIRPRPQVKAVVYGHSHRWTTEERDGLHLVNLPAVAYPFADDQPLGWCRFRPRDGGAEIELRCVAGDKRKDRLKLSLTWRTA